MEKNKSFEFFANNPTVLEKETERQKHSYTNFNIICPKITKDEVIANTILTYPNHLEISLNLNWCKFSYNKAKIYHNALKEMYQCEQGSLFGKPDYKEVYLLCINLKKEKMLNSNRWVVVGGFATSEHALINFIWIHPHLRRNGIGTLFFSFYTQNENPLILLPPISDGMRRSLEKMEIAASKDSDVMKNIIQVSRKYYQKYYGIDKAKTEKLTDKHFMEFNAGINNIHAALAKDGKGTESIENINKFYGGLIDMHIKMQENPNLRQQMEDYAKATIDLDEVKESHKQMMDLGVQDWKNK